jgi:hypothetical protein
VLVYLKTIPNFMTLKHSHQMVIYWYRLFHIVNLATRSVKTVKAVFKHNSYSEHFLVWCARQRKTSLQFFSLPGIWANLKDNEKNASVITTTSRPALGPTQPPIQGVPGALSVGGKAAGA